MKGKYDDMINLPHPVSKKHPQMSLYDRAAQFAPFAALTGYEDAIKETARTTEVFRPVLGREKEEIDQKLYDLQQNQHNHPQVFIEYFVPDVRKEGGKYHTLTGKVRQIDSVNKQLVIENGTTIPFKYIRKLNNNLIH